MTEYGTKLRIADRPPELAVRLPVGMQALGTLGVLFLANLLNSADRALLGVVAEPVKRDLGLSDIQLSLLTGVLFVTFNLFAGVLIAHRVDRGHRKQILALGVAVWSLSTAFTALAEDFASLALCRILVGVGEATCFPVALSMIGDLFRPAGRPRAVALYQAGGVLGFVVGVVLAGVLAAEHGWRTMFAVCGASGLVVLVLLLAMPEPPRSVATGRFPERAEGEGLGSVIRSLLARPGFAWLALAYGLASMSVSVVTAWGPAFLQRSHQVPLSRLGAVIGPSIALGGVAGIILSGLCASWCVRRWGQDRAALLVPMVALPLAAPAVAVFLHSPTLTEAMIAAAVMNFLISCATPPCVATAVGLAPPHVRGVASTLMLLSHGLIGSSLGPFLVGLLSDLVTPQFGAHGLRHAMGVMFLAPLTATYLLVLAYRAFGRTASR